MITKNRFVLIAFALWLPLSVSEFAFGTIDEVEPNDSIAQAQDLEIERWSLDSDPNIGNTTTNTSTTIPHVTILGTGDSTFDYFSFSVASAGDVGIFDVDTAIDGSSFLDSYLRLFDSRGSEIAADDDSSNSWGADGSTSSLDSYIEFTFPAAGTYFIEVGSCCIGPVPPGGDYVLQVSIESHSLGRSFDGRIVFMGLNPSERAHAAEAEARILAGNATRWAGRDVDPKVAYVEGGGDFDSEVGVRLAEAGLTDLTEIPASAIAAEDLSPFDVLYVGATTDVSVLLVARDNIGAFRGGLVVEPNVFDPGAWIWVPYAGFIGHSGATNIGGETVHIVDPSHPVMAGLSNAGLSDWNTSVHSTFSTPENAGFLALANDSPELGDPVIIVADPLIFADGFETGDHLMWSAAVP